MPLTSKHPSRNARRLFTGLPYLDNVGVVSITLAINLVCALVFLGRQILLSDLLVDALICGILTSFIDVFVIHHLVNRAAERGEIPQEVPESAFMMHLPKKPLALAALYAVVFGLLMMLISWLLVLFYGVTTPSFISFLVWKAIYSCILSGVIIEYVIFRFVQPDCLDRKSRATATEGTVKNPLPRMSMFRTVFDSVVANLGMNLTFGLLFGGVVIQGTSVLISPTLGASIWISGLFFGVLTCAMGVPPVMSAANEQIARGLVPEESLRPTSRWLAWMPHSKVGLTLLMCLPVSIVSAICLTLIASVFGFVELNFYQFTVLITAWGMLAAKAISKIVLARCLQPDYVAKKTFRGTEV
jgi:hypothetical protein